MAQQQFEDLNSGFIQELFEQYLRFPETVDPAWRKLFEQAPEALAESSPSSSGSGSCTRAPPTGATARPRRRPWRPLSPPRKCSELSPRRWPS